MILTQTKSHTIAFTSIARHDTHMKDIFAPHFQRAPKHRIVWHGVKIVPSFIETCVPLQSFLDEPSTTSCVEVIAWTVVMRASSI